MLPAPKKQAANQRALFHVSWRPAVQEEHVEEGNRDGSDQGSLSRPKNTSFLDWMRFLARTAVGPVDRSGAGIDLGVYAQASDSPSDSQSVSCRAGSSGW